MPLFCIAAVRVTPILTNVQPTLPLEAIIVEPTTIIAADLERAKLEIGRRLDSKENLALVKFVVMAIPYTA